jgi:HSP20 family molecular chaperone IbpA
MTTNELRKNGAGTASVTAPAVREATCTPRVDVLETGEELIVYADLPGVRPEDLELHWEDRQLVLHGRVRAGEGGRRPLLREYGTRDFQRVFRVSEDVDPDRISAELKGGVLTLRLPRADHARPRKIPVSGE